VISAEITFAAPWGTALKVMTLLGCMVGLGIPLVGLFTGPRSGLWLLLMVVLPLVVLLSTSLFAVRGYSLRGETLSIQRLGWHTTIPLHQLQAATIDPQVMEQSLRLWGNGGLFAFVGRFRNRRLGTYYAYATKLDHAVVLTLPQRRLVVTPDDPQRFVRAVLAMEDLAP
jgi:hypothetical protein